MFDFDTTTLESRDYVLAGLNGLAVYYIVPWIFDNHDAIPWGQTLETSAAFGLAVLSAVLVIVNETLRPTGFRGGSR